MQLGPLSLQARMPHTLLLSCSCHGACRCMQCMILYLQGCAFPSVQEHSQSSLSSLSGVHVLHMLYFIGFFRCLRLPHALSFQVSPATFGPCNIAVLRARAQQVGMHCFQHHACTHSSLVTALPDSTGTRTLHLQNQTDSAVYLFGQHFKESLLLSC